MLILRKEVHQAALGTDPKKAHHLLIATIQFIEAPAPVGLQLSTEVLNVLSEGFHAKDYSES